MPFPADENFIYRVPEPTTAPFSVLSCTRFTYSSGVATDNARNTVGTTSNIPDSGSVTAPGNRRLAAVPVAFCPFDGTPFSGVTYGRLVNNAFPATGTTPTLADFFPNVAIYIGERDFYRWYLLTYLAAIDTPKGYVGQINAIDYTNILFLFNLVGAGFVTNATLPEIPRYFR